MTKGIKRTSDHLNVKRQFTRIRIIKDGYPIESKVFTHQEVLEYFNRDTITCLMCGKEFKAIRPFHLSYVHNMTMDEYRERYGLPYTKGLLSKISHDKQKDRMISLIEDKKIIYDPMNTKKAHEKIRLSGMRTSSSKKKRCTEQQEKANKSSVISRTIKDDVFKEIQVLIDSGIGVCQAIKILGISKSTFYKRKREKLK